MIGVGDDSRRDVSVFEFLRICFAELLNGVRDNRQIRLLDFGERAREMHQAHSRR